MLNELTDATFEKKVPTPTNLLCFSYWACIASGFLLLCEKLHAQATLIWNTSAPLHDLPLSLRLFLSLSRALGDLIKRNDIKHDAISDKFVKQSLVACPRKKGNQPTKAASICGKFVVHVSNVDYIHQTLVFRLFNVNKTLLASTLPNSWPIFRYTRFYENLIITEFSTLLTNATVRSAKMNNIGISTTKMCALRGCRYGWSFSLFSHSPVIGLTFCWIPSFVDSTSKSVQLVASILFASCSPTAMPAQSVPYQIHVCSQWINEIYWLRAFIWWYKRTLN